MTIDDERPRPAKGLSNLGNTCFYNSTMQCLMHTHALYKWQEMVTEKKELVITKKTVVVNEKKVEVPDAVITLEETHALPLVNSLQNFLAEFRCSRNPNPSPLFSQIALKAPRFRGWAQQDAHELLRYLLDGIRTEELKRFRDAILTHLGVEDKPDPEKALLCKAMLESTDRCYVDSIFGGSLLQCITCSECKHLSNSLEPFLDLSLPLNYGTPVSPTVHYPPPRVRREQTPSKHQLKKMEKKKKKEARRAARMKKEAATELSENPVDTCSENHINGENHNSPSHQVPETAAEADDIKDIDLSDSDGQSSAEDMSVSDAENDVNSNHVAENSGDVPPDPEDPWSSPNYNISLASSPATEDDHGEHLSVINSLKQFTAPENLCDKNKYECESCCAPHNKTLPSNSKAKMTVEATKQYLIYSPPCVLTVHLKRFEQVAMTTFGNRMRTRKIRGHVEFPFILDISQFCSKNGQRLRSSQNEVVYSLYGIVSHSGDLGGGHYVAYVKSRNKVECLQQFMEAGLKPDRLCETMEELNNGNSAQQINSSLSKEEIIRQLDDGATWYYASDSHVRTITVDEVKHAEAYILFYERIV